MNRGFFSALFRSFWLVVVLFVTLGLYADGMRRKGVERARLEGERARLDQKIAALRAQVGRLRAEMDSQDDPAFVEMVLMRKLGLVPEEMTKVYFK